MIMMVIVINLIIYVETGLNTSIPRVMPSQNMIRSTKKDLLCTLRNVLTQISLRNPRMLIQADTFRLRGIKV